MDDSKTARLIDHTLDDLKRLENMKRDFWRSLLALGVLINGLALLAWLFEPRAWGGCIWALCSLVGVAAFQVCVYIQIPRSRRKLMRYRKEQLRDQLEEDREEVPDGG